MHFRFFDVSPIRQCPTELPKGPAQSWKSPRAAYVTPLWGNSYAVEGPPVGTENSVRSENEGGYDHSCDHGGYHDELSSRRPLRRDGL